MQLGAASGTPLSRRALCAWLASFALGAASPARASSYRARAWLLIGEASRANEFLGKHVRDRELARLVAQAAEGRVQAAKDTPVPEALALAHPHLLLMLEHYERAASEAASGDAARYALHASSARDEEQIFRSVLQQLGWSLPSGRP